MRPNPHDLGRVFNEVPELYDRVRPGYPDELFADLVAVTGTDDRSSVLEVGCGTGQATRSLGALGFPMTALEPGAEMAELARQRLADLGNVTIEVSAFEEWDGRGARFDVIAAASSWHWVDPAVGWQRARDLQGGIAAAIIHVHDLDRQIALFGKLARDLGELRVQARQVVCLVVERNHDGKAGLHGPLYSVSASRIELVAGSRATC